MKMPAKKTNNRDWLNGARFIMSISDEELDKKICKGNVCYIDISEGCGTCCRNYLTGDKTIRVYNNSGSPEITNRMLVQAFINNNYENCCSHYFLESFRKDSSGMGLDDTIFKPFWGS